jgi:hypothetical protein
VRTTDDHQEKQEGRGVPACGTSSKRPSFSGNFINLVRAPSRPPIPVLFSAQQHSDVPKYKRRNRTPNR